MNKSLEVSKGKEVVNVLVTGHSYVRMLNAAGEETFRSDSPGKHVTAVVGPGRFTIETDGKLGQVELASLPSHLRAGRELDAARPPLLKTKSSRPERSRQ